MKKWHIYYKGQLIGTLKQIPSCKTETSSGEPLKFLGTDGKERSTHSSVTSFRIDGLSASCTVESHKKFTLKLE